MATDHLNESGSGNSRSAGAPLPTINGLAVASLVLGILWLMWVGSILALIFGYVGKNQIDKSPHTEGGRGLAVAGIVLGWVGVGSLVLMVTMSLTGVFTMPTMPMMNRMVAGDDFASNGERIYASATSNSGDPITHDGGPGNGMMSGVLACVDCHGADGRGGERRMMMETFRAPDIRWEALTGDHADHKRSAGGEHPPYTTETLRLAITRGIDSGGEPLDPAMPRWSMTRNDLSDLIEYLQTLGSE
jgi:mono/diheme cytochrome c family protein